jgi:hypothetical protein
MSRFKLKIEEAVSALGLKTIGNVKEFTPLDSYVEVENHLGRAWMVLLSFNLDEYLPDILFVSSPPEYETYLNADFLDKYTFLEISDIYSVDDLVGRFKDQTSYWDVKYLQSVVGL